VTRLSALLAAAGLLGLAGCSSDNGTEFSQYYEIMRRGFSGALRSSQVTLKQAADIPYASMGWRLNDSGQNLIVLATDTGTTQMWTAANHIVLQTSNGHIVRTVGLPHDLTALASANGQDLPPPGRALSGPFSQRRLADFADIGAYNVTVTCRTQRMGPQAVRILGKSISTIRVEERCEAPSMNWSFTDSYWVDQTGFAWRSRQTIRPDMVIETEILRPPG
jgi:hypothetical protein